MVMPLGSILLIPNLILVTINKTLMKCVGGINYIILIITLFLFDWHLLVEHYFAFRLVVVIK